MKINSIPNYPPYSFRLNQLKKLKEAIESREDRILEALKKDMRKPEYEAYTSEIGLIYRELNEAIKMLDSWMADEKISSPLYIQPARSFIRPVPKGLVLIISPWNYPFLLSFSPMIGAIAAGNKIVLKPSNKSYNSSSLIEEIVKDSFPESYIQVVTGPGSQVVEPLIKENDFQHIFFTGSLEVGRRIALLAAQDLIPVSLELGGKSPVIVDETADLDEAARKIVWAKFFNTGQTCIAADYLLVKSEVKSRLVELIIDYIEKFYGKKPQESKDYGRIIDLNAFKRLEGLLDRKKLIYGGDLDEDDLYISPSLLDADLEDRIMKEEIFGPLLPILEYNSRDEAVDILSANPYPLALYLFTKDKSLEEDTLNNIPFGGGCINDLMSHMINTNMPFGGIRTSGLGSYHGKKSFDEFSHFKSIVKSKTKIDIDLKYPPYNETNLNMTKKFLK